jgi:hypothetical protein
MSKAAHGTSVHDKIDYALTETRVMLPGAQALFGFQLLVPLTTAFETLPTAARTVHFVALLLVAMTIVLLIAPAAIHRIAFEGADDRRFLRLASRFVTAALIPLALGVASEMYVAGVRLLPDSPFCLVSGMRCRSDCGPLERRDEADGSRCARSAVRARPRHHRHAARQPEQIQVR